MPNTILVVDDCPVVRECVRRILLREYTVLQAGTVHAAMLQMVQHGGVVDLVIVDKHLGNSDGGEFVKILRRAHPLIRVVMFSGGTISIEDQQSADCCIRKPVEPDDLRQVVAGLLMTRQVAI